MVTARSRLLTSLRPGDLVVADSGATKKFHLVRLTRCAAEIDSRHGKGGRDYSDCWLGNALCGVDPTRATFGNYTTYYWMPRGEDPDRHALGVVDLCKQCHRAHERAGRPEVKALRVADLGEPEPPFGWREVAPEGHPYDVPSGGDVDAVKNAAGEVVGKLRQELRRWRRGDLVVRIVKLLAPDADVEQELRHHRVDRVLQETWDARGSAARVRRRAHELMAKGGR